MDPQTVLGGGLALLGSKDLLNRLLGPSADYLGTEIENVVEKSCANVSRIFKIALRKLGKRLEQPGGVNPKVLKGVVNEGKFCEDEVAAEYIGGVLASSRTETLRDDRGATYIGLISSLSTYQLRTHYIFYTLLRRTFLPYSSVIHPGTDRQLMRIYIPTAEYFSFMDLDSDFPTDEKKTGILTHSVNGLRRENLVGEVTFGERKVFLDGPLNRFPDRLIEKKILAEHGITFLPNPEGMELYLWGQGLGDHTHLQFLIDELLIEPLSDIPLPENAAVLYAGLVDDMLKTRGAGDGLDGSS